MSDQVSSPGPAKVEKKEDEQQPRPSFGQALRDTILEGHTVTIIILAIFTGFVVGGLLNAFTNTTVLHAGATFSRIPAPAQRPPRQHRAREHQEPANERPHARTGRARNPRGSRGS